MTDLNDTLKFIMQRYDPLGQARCLSWSIHSIPFWSNPAERQVGLRVVCYRDVESTAAQVAGMALRTVEALVMGVATGIGVEEIGLVGGTGFAPVDQTSTVLGKAQTLHGVAGGPNAATVGNMQVAAARDSGNAVGLYHAIKAGGRVLLEAVVRIEPITGGTRILVHAVRDAVHADLLEAKITEIDTWPQTKTYWIYSNDLTFENGNPIGTWRNAS